MKKLIICLGVLGMTFLQAEEGLDMKKALKTLHPLGNESFVFVPSGIQKPELFEKLKVTNLYSGHFVGELQLLHEQFVNAMIQMGNDDKELIEEAATELVNLTHRVLKAQGGDNCTVIFRSSLPMDWFAIPRWHIDGGNKLNDQVPPKFVITLKGPTTLFQPSNCDKSPTFVQTLDELDKKREELALFYSMCDVIRPKNCEGAFFIIRNANAAVHSEPDITEARIFMSIMSATEEEIKEIRSRMNAREEEIKEIQSKKQTREIL